MPISRSRHRWCGAGDRSRPQGRPGRGRSRQAGDHSHRLERAGQLPAQRRSHQGGHILYSHELPPSPIVPYYPGYGTDTAFSH